MLISQVVVNLPRGLQSAKNTADFVVIASSFSSKINITYKEVTIGIDIMEIMDLNVGIGQEITLIVNGADEQSAVCLLRSFLLGNSGLDSNYSHNNAC